jgi:hypothetical protein
MRLFDERRLFDREFLAEGKMLEEIAEGGK